MSDAVVLGNFGWLTQEDGTINTLWCSHSAGDDERSRLAGLATFVAAHEAAGNIALRKGALRVLESGKANVIGVGQVGPGGDTRLSGGYLVVFRMTGPISFESIGIQLLPIAHLRNVQLGRVVTRSWWQRVLRALSSRA